MKTKYIRSSATQTRYWTPLWLFIGALWLPVISAHAQFATIKGTIQTQRKVKVVGATVRVIDSESHMLKHNPLEAQANGEYTMDDLLPGRYDFVACGLPYDPDKQNTKIKVQRDEIKTIRFVLQDRPPLPKIHFHLEGPQDTNTDGLMYLRDRATGCVVARAASNANGEYEFTGVEPGYDLCTRKLGAHGDAEEYICHASF